LSATWGGMPILARLVVTVRRKSWKTHSSASVSPTLESASIRFLIWLNPIPFSRILHNILDPEVLDEEPVLLKGQYWRCSGDGVSGHGPERLLSC
jgi:hypothetical protein